MLETDETPRLVRLEGLGKGQKKKNPPTSSGIEHATFQLVAKRRVPLGKGSGWAHNRSGRYGEEKMLDSNRTATPILRSPSP
jgi:hypothetical protein